MLLLTQFHFLEKILLLNKVTTNGVIDRIQYFQDGHFCDFMWLFMWLLFDVTLYLFLMQEKYFRERTQKIFDTFNKYVVTKTILLFRKLLLWNKVTT